MKIAFVSVYRDGTGYANAAKDYINCLLKSKKIQVEPVWITLSGNPHPTTKEIKELEDRATLEGIDLIIQCTLPEHFVKTKKYPCIGLFFWETTHFTGSGWQHHCNLMDAIWVTTLEQKNACIDSGVTVPVIEINYPIDFAKYNGAFNILDFGKKINRTFKFYTISDISYRKNVAGLLSTYYSAFGYNDNVSLIIKGFVNGLSEEDSGKFFDGMMGEIKKELQCGDQKLPPVVFIPQYLKDSQIMDLHNTCDCYISMSKGEGVCLPLIDAIGMKNLVIAPNWNGPKKFLNNSIFSLKIDQLIEKTMYGQGNNFIKHLYNRDETWFEPSMVQAKKLMKDAVGLKPEERDYIVNDVYNMNYKAFNDQLVLKELEDELIKIYNK